MPRPLVAIIGRPNVGKSTLFNRLTKSRNAIVDDQPGVTRDRIYGTVEWADRMFDIVDTGGIILEGDGQIEVGIREQAFFATEEATLTLLMVDAATGPTDEDMRITKQLLKAKRPIIIVANKADNPQLEWDSGTFVQLGAGEPFAISALHGRNMWELIDEIGKRIPITDFAPPSECDVRIAIIGRPNVGKSSLVNLLLGEDRMLVADAAGTTRDSIDSRLNFQSKSIVLTDTAGLRRRSKIERGLEQFTLVRSYRALEGADVAIMLVDAKIGFGTTEDAIMKFAWDKGIGLIVAMNKWDLVEKDQMSSKKLEQDFYDRYPQLESVPLRFISVHNKLRIFKTLEQAIQISEARKKKIATSELNRWLEPLWKGRPPPAVKAKYIKVKFITQTGITPPRFSIFCSHADLVPDNYKRYIERQFRLQFPYIGCNIFFEYRQK